MNSKFSPVGTMHQKYGQILEGWLARNHYPRYVRPKSILQLEPGLMDGLGLSRKGQERVLGACISAYRSPTGARYVKYNTRQWKLMSPQELTPQEVAACE